MSRSLRGMIIEDESLVAMLIEDMLTDAGHSVVATAGRLDQALKLASSAECDFAVVDLNLNGERTDALPPLLQARGIPFVFATGYGSAGVSDGWRHVPVLQKPFQAQDLLSAIRKVVGHAN